MADHLLTRTMADADADEVAIGMERQQLVPGPVRQGGASQLTDCKFDFGNTPGENVAIRSVVGILLVLLNRK